MCQPKNVFLHLLYIISFAKVVDLSIKEQLKEDFFRLYKTAAIETRVIQQKPVTEDEVNFYLYSSENPLEYTLINTTNFGSFRNTSNQIVLLIHGWVSSRESLWMENMKNAFFVRDKNNSVIIVDWKNPANQFYYVSSINTYDVAKFVTKLLTNLYENYGVDKNKFLLVGHSLGGQICGFTGRLFKNATSENLPRIIALDPAGPLFDVRPIDKRLSKDDAEVVEVIHTDGGKLGFRNTCGTVDFFMNGGSGQPGCKRIDLADLLNAIPAALSCDHARATEYFTEAILNPTDFVAQKCSNWAQYQTNNCDKETVALGDLTTNLTGSFFVETNKEKPYAKKASKGLNLSQLLKL